MPDTFCSISAIAREIPDLPPQGAKRLTALRRAVTGRKAPAALGVRRRPVHAAESAVVAKAQIRPTVTIVCLSEEEARAIPTEARYFDPQWYLKTNPDVRRAGMNPVQHYRQTGAKEGRNPNPYFDSADYLAANPDVVEKGLEAFRHFIMYGIAERRRLKP
ncbi:hypothetical protein AA0472_0829 [Acetobacter estunensis NRIC 0472]|uniref:hypothetical protein n=1 Tax=Acetobacter estunensis TaxID=104097 RepID=UPI001F55246F|nr:hypothetical protein [Acetobacter estunensis]GBQ22640.1 hypothetical protein AA0472_0829 [Acetobacter estunensis NRIC 0472]